MDFGITNKRALVLASSKGIGRGIAEALAAEGADVLLCGRTSERLDEGAEAINGRGGGRASVLTVDLADKDAAGRLHAAALDLLGGVDILVNNTGGPPPGGARDPDADAWRQQFDTMILRLIEITGLCLPAMVEAGWGRVLTVASSGVVQPIPNLAISNTLRPAIIGWSKTLAGEVASSGVTVNVLLPGRIATERNEVLAKANAERLGKTVEEVKAAAQADIPAGRYGTVEEFAAVATFLCSGPASYVTGTVVRCDGGVVRAI